MSAPAVQFSRVTKRYRERIALDGVSFEIPRGVVYGLLGPNGAGKSTTLRLLTGILHQDAGEVRVLDGAPKSMSERLGFLPEERGLYRRMRIIDQLIFLGRLKGLSRPHALASANQWLQRFGLDDRAKARCDTLSKGLSQKVQLIGTLLHRPELIVLDEPFSGLDPVNVETVRQCIRELRNEGRTVILSTHAMEQAEQLCDHILLIHRGRIVLQGTQSEVRSHGDSHLRIHYRGDGRQMEDLPGLLHLRDTGQHAEIALQAGHDPQQALAWLLARLQVESFDRRAASLHDIFIRAIGSEENQ